MRKTGTQLVLVMGKTKRATEQVSDWDSEIAKEIEREEERENTCKRERAREREREWEREKWRGSERNPLSFPGKLRNNRELDRERERKRKREWEESPESGKADISMFCLTELGSAWKRPSFPSCFPWQNQKKTRQSFPGKKNRTWKKIPCFPWQN
jgi:hypothetical protein